MDSTLLVIALAVALGLVVGIGFALVRTRRRRPPGIEPPPSAPGITPEIKEDVARRREEFLARLEEEERQAKEAQAAGTDQEALPPASSPDLPSAPPASPWDRARRTGGGAGAGTTEPPPATPPEVQPGPSPEPPTAVDDDLAAAVEEALAPAAEVEDAPTDVVEVDISEIDIEVVEEAPDGSVDVVEEVAITEVEVVEAPPVGVPPVEAPPVEPAPVEAPVRPRFRDRLAKARSKLAGVLGGVAGRSKIDAEAYEDLEEALIGADVGIELTESILDSLRERVKAEGLQDGAQLLEGLKAELKQRLSGFEVDLAMGEQTPAVWLFVGVNGVGKTTTIGKLGKREVAAGRSVVMAAGDTFRAAAAEQLGMWAERCGADLVRGAEGGDPSAVIFDAVESAAAKGTDLVLADTAGRLHTKANLMEELRKVRRVAEKGAGTVTEVLLVLDATTGQNGLRQAEQFTEAVEVTGVVLTKLDGSAKGGIIFAVQDQLGIPVKLVGLGETADDLVPFDADEFVEALFA